MANNNKFMEITKWKKIEARAKRANKWLDKVANWSEEDDDYNDDVSYMDAWEYGTEWIDNWYDAVVENGLYDLNGKKIHILYKSPRVDVDDGVTDGHHEILIGLDRFGFRTENFIQIDYNHEDWKAETIEWCVVAVVDGIKTLIIPHKKGDFNPKDESWGAWHEIAKNDDSGHVEYDDVMEDDVIANHDSVDYMKSTNIEYLSWYCRNYDYENSGLDIRWSKMRRMA